VSTPGSLEGVEGSPLGLPSEKILQGSAGTYLALAALNRLVAPCSKAAFADWWKTTAGDRLTRIGVPALDHRDFWDAMHAVTLLSHLAGIGETVLAYPPPADGPKHAA